MKNRTFARLRRVVAGALAALLVCAPVAAVEGTVPAAGTGDRVVLQLGNSSALQNGACVRIAAENGAALTPVKQNGRTLLPLRWLADTLGCTTTWDGKTQTVSLSGARAQAQLIIGQPTMTVHGVSIALDAPATLRGGITYVPARAVGEAFGWQLAYVDEARGGLIFLVDTQETFTPTQEDIASALAILGPSQDQVLVGGLLLRVGSDYAVTGGGRAPLAAVPIAAEGYYWVPVEACAQALGMTVQVAADAASATVTAQDGAAGTIARGSVTYAGQTQADEKFLLRTENKVLYATPQAFAAATGREVMFPSTDTIALTATKLYGFAEQIDYAAALADALPLKETPKPATPTGKGYIALTFDDGPTGGSSGFTVRLLDGLKARGAHATFFMCGYRIKDFHTHMKRYLDEGHELGNHTMDHPLRFSRLSGADVFRQVDSNSKLIESYTGARPTVMRPVGGAVRGEVAPQMKKLGLPIINWSVDTLDWKYRDAARIKRVIIEEAKDGSIVLMHDLHEPTLEGVLGAIDELQKQGYAFVTVHELAQIKGVTLEPGKVYNSIR